MYLCKYGYLKDEGDFVEAVKDFQRFVKITPTGKHKFQYFQHYISNNFSYVIIVMTDVRQFKPGLDN